MTDIAKILGGSDGKTFFGLQHAEVDALDEIDAAIVGIPCATPYATTGTYAAGAPAAMRKAVAPDAQNPPHMDFDLGGATLADATARCADLGDIPWSETDHARNRQTITSTIARIADAGTVPIILGGDDSVPIPVYQGLANHGPFTILQIDAHIDWRDDVNGERFGLSSNMRRASEMPHIEQIIQVGARGIGSARPSDHEDATAWGVDFMPASKLMREGVDAALALVPDGANLLLNFDVDALDPAIMPAVIGPAPGGLSYWQAVDLIRGAIRKTNLRCFSIVEFYPDRDADGVAALTAGRIVCNVLGELARRSPPTS